MAVLDSCPKHNMVAYLEKSEGNVEFHEIIDFLKRSSIHHALTVSPVISTTFVEQFWTSAKSKMLGYQLSDTRRVACLASCSSGELLLSSSLRTGGLNRRRVAQRGELLIRSGLLDSGLNRTISDGNGLRCYYWRIPEGEGSNKVYKGHLLTHQSLYDAKEHFGGKREDDSGGRCMPNFKANMSSANPVIIKFSFNPPQNLSFLDTCNWTQGGSSTENLIECVSKHTAFSTQSYKFKSYLKLNNQLRASSNARQSYDSKTGKCFVKRCRTKQCDTISRKNIYSRKTISENQCNEEMELSRGKVGAQNEEAYYPGQAKPIKVLQLYRTRAHSTPGRVGSMDEERRCLLAGEQGVTNVEDVVDDYMRMIWHSM
ncbi:hypothetical protein Tco_0768746 [Tanacetum coccineum]